MATSSLMRLVSHPASLGTVDIHSVTGPSGRCTQRWLLCSALAPMEGVGEQLVDRGFLVGEVWTYMVKRRALSRCGRS